MSPIGIGPQQDNYTNKFASKLKPGGTGNQKNVDPKTTNNQKNMESVNPFLNHNNIKNPYKEYLTNKKEITTPKIFDWKQEISKDNTRVYKNIDYNKLYDNHQLRKELDEAFLNTCNKIDEETKKLIKVGLMKLIEELERMGYKEDTIKNILIAASNAKEKEFKNRSHHNPVKESLEKLKFASEAVAYSCAISEKVFDKASNLFEKGSKLAKQAEKAAKMSEKVGHIAHEVVEKGLIPALTLEAVSRGDGYDAVAAFSQYAGPQAVAAFTAELIGMVDHEIHEKHQKHKEAFKAMIEYETNPVNKFYMNVAGGLSDPWVALGMVIEKAGNKWSETELAKRIGAFETRLQQKVEKKLHDTVIQWDWYVEICKTLDIPL